MNRYTTKNGNLYVSFMPWPSSGVLKLDHPIPSNDVSAVMLGYDEKSLTVEKNNGKAGIIVQLPGNPLKVKTNWMYTLCLTGFDA